MKFSKSKKAQGGLPMWLIVLIIALVAGGIMIFGVQRGWFRFTKSTESLTISSAALCAGKIGVKTPDIDGDGLKDTCDNCVCLGNPCKNAEYDFSDPLRPKAIPGTGGPDSDKDGIPDICEPDTANDAQKVTWAKNCNPDYIKEGRCVLS